MGLDIRDLKLTEKGLILISVPLCFGLIFLFVLTNQLYHSDIESRKETRSLAAIRVVEELNSRFNQSLASALLYFDTKDTALKQKFEAERDSLPQKFMEASSLLGVDENQTRILEKLKLRQDEIYTLIDEESKTPFSPNKTETSSKRWQQIHSLLLKNENDTKKLLDMERAESVAVSRSAQESRISPHQFLLIGAGVSFLIGSSLVLLFMKTISDRLLATMDNALRLANGEPLRPRIKGKDEIATLDRVFHEMAQALEDASQRERAVVENAIDVILSVDSELRFLSVSPASTRVFGYAPDQLAGRRLTDFIVADDIPSTRNAAEAVSAKSASLKFENRFMRQDGQTINVLWSASWSRSENAMFLVAHDITERKVAEEKLRASEERVRHIIESMPISLFIVDDRGYIELTNLTAESMFQYSYQELIGERLDKLLSVSYESLSQETASQGAKRSIEAEARRKGERIFPVEISINKVTFTEGERSLVTMVDVTERHEVERLKREFVAMVSHDLRTPLSSVQGVLALLSEGVIGSLSQRGSHLVTSAEEQIARLMTLLNDLLDLERMEAGKFDIKLEKVKLSEVIAPSIEAVARVAEYKEVTIKSPTVSLVVTADGPRLTQVLVNLLSNAVKFSPRGATVTVEVNDSDSWVEVSVEDQGRGIPREHLDAVFDKFHQVEAGDAKEKGGTGLGLPICKMIIEGHHGQIGVDSVEGKGSRFWFRLPDHQA